MHDALGAAQPAFDLTVHQAALTHLIAAAKVRDLVIPGQRQQTAVVTHHTFENSSPRAAHVALRQMGDLTNDADHVADAERADLADRAPVLIPERNVVEQILDGVDAEFLELFTAARTDTADELSRL